MGLDNQNVKGADALVAKLRAAQRYIENDVPLVIGVEAVKHFKKNFEDEGFDGNKWADRREPKPTKILTGSGNGDHLSDSIDFRIDGDTVIIFSDKLYAQIHNEGGEIDVSPQMRRYFWAMYYQAKENGSGDEAEHWKYMALSKKIDIKQRQFIGDSPQLDKNIIDKITRDLNRILN